MDLNSLKIFDKVADLGSFSLAAQQLGIPKSNVSLKIRQLEETLGIRLFERTTRKVAITQHGETIRNITKAMMDEVAAIQDLAESAVATPKGLVRISLPADLGFYLLTEVMNEFLTQFPQVDVELNFANRYVDLIHEGFDLAIRASEKALLDSSLVSKKIVATTFRFYATPVFLRQVQPRKISDLNNINIIAMGNTQKIWVSNGKTEQNLQVRRRLRLNDMHAAKQAVLANLGIGLLPDFICLKEVGSGLLEEVLPSWTSTKASFHLVYPSKRLLPPRTRVLIDFLTQHFTKRP